MRVAVIGHIEWITFLRVDRVPAPGEIVHAQAGLEMPAGGGGATAVQLAKLADEVHLFTALGDDDLGKRSIDALGELGLQVHAVFRPEPTRRAVVHIDSDGERTITVIGNRMGVHHGDPVPWDELKHMDAAYFCAGDEAALRAGREARVLVSTARVLPTVISSGVQLDVVVGSDADPGERMNKSDFPLVPDLLVWTRGAQGGRWSTGKGDTGRFDAPPLSGEVRDRYGAGDGFVGGLTYAMTTGADLKAALGFAAACGAAALGGNGPYETQLTRLDPAFQALQDRLSSN